ncbi:multidrug effflux MFS transporter [Blastococcus haudaquaticus]|uniref:MFS transporter, DHA1 family, bicyclomycin/chloramphenicol resistance protein n=1 Tax=Blastococcus haudaquaticus TaxID=1938745 RepID=A0A286H3A8_9ACTN|nr:multidrug effflux MFS transporter [Blastococcus haudaquaticus]SOE02265.1 MFS transporter, DHA1 family, bicyclomycin/chloramphenicol resistance protein [Blastococcus haudaquaticus]
MAVVLVLGLLTALGPLSIDLYLPAFPVLRHDLGATDGMVQATLAGMTIGLGAGQLVVGAWSDRVGRRRPLLLSTALHVLATLACAMASTGQILVVCRVVQGIGAAGSAVLVLAIVRDLADGQALAVLLSRVTLVTTTVPLLAPVLGAELLPVVGWRGIFLILAATSAVMLVTTVLVIPETADRRSRPAPLTVRVRAVWADRAFRRATLVASMTYAGVYAYVAASPLLLQDAFDLSARAFAVVFLCNSLGLVAGVQLASLLVRRYGTASTLAGFTVVTAAAAAAILPLQAWGTGAVLVCLWFFVAGCGGCFPCAEAISLDGQGAQAGTATSVHGFATFTVAGLVSPIAGLVGITDATPVALVLLATSLISLVGTGLLLRAPAQPDPGDPAVART